MGNRVQPDLKTQRAIEIRDRSTGVAREKRPGGPPLPPCPQTARGKFALSIRRAASKRPDFRPCSPVPHPPQRKARASRFWALRSRLGAGGARRLTPSHIAQQRFKNQKPSLVWEQEDYNPTESFHRAKTKVQEPESPASKNANPRGRKRFP